MAAETDVGDNEVRHALPSDNSPVRRHFDDRTGIECGEADIARSSDCQAVKARLFASAADERSAIGSRPRPLSHLAQRDDVPRPQTPRYCLGDIEFLAVGRQSYAVWRDHSADHFADFASVGSRPIDKPEVEVALPRSVNQKPPWPSKTMSFGPL